GGRRRPALDGDPLRRGPAAGPRRGTAPRGPAGRRVITEATLCLATASDAAAALLRVAGQPVAFRALDAAVRAGCRRVAVPGRFRGTAVERAIAASPSARAATIWLEGQARSPGGPSLLIPAAALVSDADLWRMVRG